MKTSINILGCCVSRDTFGLFPNNGNFDIKQCITNLSIISVCSPKISEEYICTEDNFPVANHYLKRCTCLDINKDAFAYLAKYDADYTIIDLGVIFSTITMKVRMKGETNPDSFTYITRKNTILDKNPDFLENAPFEILEIFRFPEKVDLFFEYLPKYAEMIKEHIDQSKIIILELPLTQRYIDREGGIRINSAVHDDEANKQVVFDIPVLSLYLKKAYQIFEKCLPQAHVIKRPNTEVLCNQNHKWGLHPLHYIIEYYRYVLDSIRAIAGASDRENEKVMLKSLHAVYNDLICSKYSATIDGEYTLKNQSLLSSKVIKFGQEITICLNALGGTGDYVYHTYIKRKTDTLWLSLGKQKHGIAQYKPKHFGMYEVCVKLKDKNNVVKKEYFEFMVR